METCVECILDQRVKGFSIDSRGVCVFCHREKQAKEDKYSKNESDLLEYIAKNKSFGKYDCIVNVSGGKDSMYVLYMLKWKYKLNPLALTILNPFVSNEQLLTVKNVTTAIGVDLFMFNNQRFKDGIRLFLQSEYRKVINVCDICDLFINPIQVAQEVAKNLGVSMIFSGSTKGQQGGTFPEYLMPEARVEYQKNMHNTKSYLAQFEEICKSFATPNESGEKIEIVSLYHFIDVDENSKKKILKQFGWRQIRRSFPGKSTNCLLSYVTGYLGRKYGIPNYELEFSRLIRAGLISRHEAIKRVSARIPLHIMRKITAILGCSVDDL